MSEARMDFIMEMYSKDHPEEFKFERPESKRRRSLHDEVRKQWWDVLMGEARMKKIFPRGRPVIPTDMLKRTKVKIV